MKKILIVLLFAILLPLTVHAALLSNPDSVDLYAPPRATSGLASRDSVINFLKDALTWLSRIFWIVAIAMILAAAFLYLTAGASEANADKAKNFLKYAIIGIVIALVSGVIPSLIQNIISGGGGGGSSVPVSQPSTNPCDGPNPPNYCGLPGN